MNRRSSLWGIGASGGKEAGVSDVRWLRGLSVFSFVSIERSLESWMHGGYVKVCLSFVSKGADWRKGRYS